MFADEESQQHYVNKKNNFIDANKNMEGDIWYIRICRMGYIFDESEDPLDDEYVFVFVFMHIHARIAL